jgi:hypothetical protein
LIVSASASMPVENIFPVFGHFTSRTPMCASTRLSKAFCSRTRLLANPAPKDTVALWGCEYEQKADEDCRCSQAKNH